jgi:hypothetical protein
LVCGNFRYSHPDLSVEASNTNPSTRDRIILMSRVALLILLIQQLRSLNQEKIGYELSVFTKDAPNL